MRCQFHQVLSRSPEKPNIESTIVGLVVGTFTFARILRRVPADLQDDLGSTASALDIELAEVREALQQIQQLNNPKIMKIRGALLLGPWANILSVMGDLVVSFTELEFLIGPLTTTTEVWINGIAKWKVRWASVSKLMIRIQRDRQILLEIVKILKG
jgi:hypothetical protein